MSLWKQAQLIGDRALNTKILKIAALKVIAQYNRRLKKVVAQAIANTGLTEKQSNFWASIEDDLIKKLRSYVNKLEYVRARGPELREDLIGEGLLAALMELRDIDEQKITPKNADKLLNKLFFAAINAIRVKGSGTRRGVESEEEYPTEYSPSGIPKPVADKPLPAIADFLNEKIRELGYTNFANVSEEEVERVIKENMDELQEIWEKENAERKQEGKKSIIPLTNILWQYKARMRQLRENALQFPYSLEEPAFAEEDSSIADTQALLPLLGFAPVSVEDEVVLQQMYDILRPTVAKLPIPIRILMIAEYDLPIEVLDANGEIAYELNRLASKYGLSSPEEFIASLKTKAGKSIVWSRAKPILEEEYGKGTLDGIKNSNDLQAYIQNAIKKELGALAVA